MPGINRVRWSPQFDDHRLQPEQLSGQATDKLSESPRQRIHGDIDSRAHMTKRGSRKEEVSPRTEQTAGIGQPCPLAVWMGMGPSGSRSRPPTLATFSCTGIIIILSILSLTVNGSLLGLSEGDSDSSDSSTGGQLGASGSGCDIIHCSNEYSERSEQMYQSDPQLSDRPAICDIIHDALRCMNLHSHGCHSWLQFHTLVEIYTTYLEENDCPEFVEEESTESGDSKVKAEVSRGDGDVSGGAVSRAGSRGHNNGRRRPPKPRPPPAMCVYQGPSVYRHCGLFGDPHLRTFQGDFQTCKVEGAWPLVQNDYLTVQVTNAPVVGSNTEVTATSKLTVIVKGNPDCTSANYVTYQAQSNSLPGTFDDGQTHVGPYHSLELIEVEADAHVEIHLRYISTVVVIRRIGRYFTFSIKIPESLLNGTGGASLGGPSHGYEDYSSLSVAEDVQLCSRGCPASELIDFQEYLASRRYSLPATHNQDDGGFQVGIHAMDKEDSQEEDDGKKSASSSSKSSKSQADEAAVLTSRSEAEIVCREAGVVGFYFDFCVFDLMATGDENFTLSAVAAMQDVLRLDPSAARFMDNRTTLDLYDQKYGGGVASGLSGVGAAWWWRTSLAGLMALFLAAPGGGGCTSRDVNLRNVTLFLATVMVLLVMSPR